MSEYTFSAVVAITSVAIRYCRRIPNYVHILFYSDGEGRTGVFVAMDILVKEGETIRKVNFLDCVKSLREQRDNMVQTKVVCPNYFTTLPYSM